MQPWLRDHTIFLTIHGSQSFGMATASSDLDIKGVCIPPASVRQHLFQGFEQAENPPLLQEDYGHLANPANPKIEGVIYELSKYIKLAAVTNPTIVELLWVDPKFILKTTPVWDLLRANRKMFVSTKAKHGFIGYATMQFSKIERHRKWLRLDKEPERPTREKFGLKAGEPTREYGEAERYIKRQVELWNLSTFELEAEERAEIKEMCWDLVAHLNQSSHIDWATWPEAYYNAALVKLQNSIQMPKEILGLIAAEKRYQDVLKEWQGYQHWKNERNAGRKEIEVKYGYDAKHASHLVRLVRSGLELMQTGELNVLRPDAQELLAIRNGAWAYEKVVEYATTMEEKFNEAEKTSPMPKNTNKEAINDLYQEALALWAKTAPSKK